MLKQNINSKKGFTIIEVVLVLAIAGLIFLMVFIAFPALQRSQRDTQRTDDMARVQAALMNWQNNHSNNLPGESTFNADAFNIDPETDKFGVQCPNGSGGTTRNPACEFVRDYMNTAANSQTGSTGTDRYDTFKDPSGEYYDVVITANVSKTLPNKTYTNTKQGLGTASIDASVEPITIKPESQQDAYTMFIIPGATCQENEAVPSSKNNFAILYMLEGSGTKCTNNGS